MWGVARVGRGRREWQEAVDALRRRGALRLHYEDLRVVAECIGHTEPVEVCAWAPDGSTLVTTSWDGTARVWSAGDWSCLRTLTGHKLKVLGCAWAPDGSTLATASLDNTTRIWSDI